MAIVSKTSEMEEFETNLIHLGNNLIAFGATKVFTAVENAQAGNIVATGTYKTVIIPPQEGSNLTDDVYPFTYANNAPLSVYTDVISNGSSENPYTACGHRITEISAGEFISFVISDQEDSYPDNGISDGYYYEKVK